MFVRMRPETVDCIVKIRELYAQHQEMVLRFSAIEINRLKLEEDTDIPIALQSLGGAMMTDPDFEIMD